MPQPQKNTLPQKRYFRIGEVCKITGLKPHVLRYWESEFKQIKPNKTRANQRLYRKRDVENILIIKNLLYDQKFTIAGAKAKMENKKGSQSPDGPPRQLSIEFDPAQREELLETLCTQLRQIRDILDRE